MQTAPTTVTVVQSLSPRQIQTWQVDWQDLLPNTGSQTQSKESQASSHSPIHVRQVLAYLHLDGDQLLQDGWRFGIWSQACQLNSPVRAGDRIELYRPLRVDPKLARRERFAKQGSRAAGLFRR